MPQSVRTERDPGPGNVQYLANRTWVYRWWRGVGPNADGEGEKDPPVAIA